MTHTNRALQKRTDLQRRAASRLGLSRQRGVFTIAAVAIISALTLVAARSITVATVDSVRLTTNSHTSTEAFYAAEDAVSQGMQWLESNDPSTVVWPATQAGTDVEFTINNGGTAITRSYSTAFGFEDGGDRVRIFGTASDEGNTEAVIAQWVKPQYLVPPDQKNFPLNLAECLDGSGVGGNPDIQADAGDGDSYPQYAQSTGCAPGAGNLNSGPSSEPLIAPQAHSGGDRWDTVFDIPRAEFYAAHTAGDYAGENVYVFSAASIPNKNSAPDTFTMPSFGSGAEFQTVNPGATVKSWGTPTAPAVVIIQGCGGINGGRTFVGVVFVEDATNPENTAGFVCDLGGSGGLKVIGSLIINGEVSQINANVDIIGPEAADLDFTSLPLEAVVTFPGTWTDLEVN